MPFLPADADSLAAYRIRDASRLLTPALLLYPELVDANVRTTLQMSGGDAGRWRPHVKTAKLPFVMQRLIAFGINAFKCSTTLELMTLCQLGAPDVLLAFPISGANAARVRQIAELWPNTRISVLVENKSQAEAWIDSRISIFIDINPGMDRTGISQDHADAVITLARFVAAKLSLAGLHYYDGHMSGVPAHEREAATQAGYTVLLDIVAKLRADGIDVLEVITSGTPAAPYALSYEPFVRSGFIHRISPGTVVYNDLNSLGQLEAYDYAPAALVLSTVVSHPAPGFITCDAGHKGVGVDSGVPNCIALGWPNLVAQKPSEEHLPFKSEGGPLPEVGEVLYLLPKHICPTVNNFDQAVIVQQGAVKGMELVSARGHESPLLMQDLSKAV